MYHWEVDNAGVEEETSPDHAYDRFKCSEPTRYRDGWLSGDNQLTK